MKNEIRSAKLNDSSIIVDILNKTTLHLHEKGIAQWAYPWDDDQIIKDINEGRLYLMTAGDTAAGTFSIKATDDVDARLIEKGHNYLYRIAVMPEYQGRNLGIDIIRFAKEYTKNTGKALYLDCWAGNKKLKDFYSDAGFEHIGDEPEDGYFISVFKWQ